MISPSFYSFLRPLLFQLDAERSHDLVLKVLKKTQYCPVLSKLYKAPLISDPLTIAGLKLPNRIGLAAGLDKNAQCIQAFASMGFGLIELGTVTPKPQTGNDKPRLFRLPEYQSLINRFGFNNDGLEAFVANIRAYQAYAKKYSYKTSEGEVYRPVIGLNIGKNAQTPIENAHEDYICGLIACYCLADYVTINISSPNTQNLRTLQNDAALRHLLHALHQQRLKLQQTYLKHVPIFIKIAPDLEDAQISALAATILDCHMDGIIATNTTLDRRSIQPHPLSHQAGGLSGAVLNARSNYVISLLRQHVGQNFPIIGVGGILNAQNALDKIQAGADAVQIYTGFIYQGPSLVTQIASTLQTTTYKTNNKITIN